MRPGVVIAHRGCTRGLPENTLAAYAWAAELGADAIELDVRLTADGHMVALHDKTLDRTTDGSGAVSRMTLAAVRRLDAGDGERIPTLEEAFDLAANRNIDVLLDIKADVDVTSLLALQQEKGLTDRIVFGSRKPRQLARFRALDPQSTTLAFCRDVDAISGFMRTGADIIRVWRDWAFEDAGLVQRILDQGARVWATTGRLRGDRLDPLLEMGIEGVITDCPDLLLGDP